MPVISSPSIQLPTSSQSTTSLSQPTGITASDSSPPIQLPTRSQSTTSLSQPTGITTQSVSELVVEIVQALQVQELNSGSLGIAPHELVSDCSIELSVSAQSLPSIGLPHRGKSWLPNYMMLAFMMNGQLFAEYQRVVSMLGSPCCSDTLWQVTISWLGTHVTFKYHI